MENRRIIKADLEELSDSTKLKKQSMIISDYISAFRYWFRNNDYEIPVLPIAERVKKEDELLQTFKKLFKDEDTTEDVVIEILWDKEYFKNPSAYMAKVRETFSLTTDEIKKHPAFAFLDPKGTANS